MEQSYIVHGGQEAEQGNRTERKWLWVIYSTQGHASLTYPNAPKIVFHQSPGWLPSQSGLIDTIKPTHQKYEPKERLEIKIKCAWFILSVRHYGARHLGLGKTKSTDYYKYGKTTHSKIFIEKALHLHSKTATCSSRSYTLWER